MSHIKNETCLNRSLVNELTNSNVFFWSKNSTMTNLQFFHAFEMAKLIKYYALNCKTSKYVEIAGIFQRFYFGIKCYDMNTAGRQKKPMLFVVLDLFICSSKYADPNVSIRVFITRPTLYSQHNGSS